MGFYWGFVYQKIKKYIGRTVSRESAPRAANLDSGVSSDSAGNASCFFTISHTFCTVSGLACKLSTTTPLFSSFKETKGKWKQEEKIKWTYRARDTEAGSSQRREATLCPTYSYHLQTWGLSSDLQKYNLSIQRSSFWHKIHLICILSISSSESYGLTCHSSIHTTKSPFSNDFRKRF